jgi:hypothetical protein
MSLDLERFSSLISVAKLRGTAHQMIFLSSSGRFWKMARGFDDDVKPLI